MLLSVCSSVVCGVDGGVQIRVVLGQQVGLLSEADKEGNHRAVNHTEQLDMNREADEEGNGPECSAVKGYIEHEEGNKGHTQCGHCQSHADEVVVPECLVCAILGQLECPLGRFDVAASVHSDIHECIG